MRNFFRKRRKTRFADEAAGDDLDTIGLERDEQTRLPRFGAAPADSERMSEGERMRPFAEGPDRAATVRTFGGPSFRTGQDAVPEDIRRAVGGDRGRRGLRQGPLVADRPDGDQETELPRFSLPINASPRTTREETAISPEMNRALREAFTPTRPKQKVNSLFVGRMQTLRRIIAAIEEERAHVVLFGDRGRGKTSLANAIQQIAGQAGYLTLKLTCSAELTFEDIFRNFLRRIPSTYYGAAAGNPFSGRPTFANFDECLPSGPFSVTELNDALCEIQGTHVLMILDEYDRITSEDVKNKLAELIKNLADSSVPVTILIVGVAENVDHLLGKHPSIQRSLVAVHLPLMTEREVERIIVAGSANAGIAFDPDVRRRIVGFAKGLPYYAQLLSLYAARSAVGRGSAEVGRDDLVRAVDRCVQEAERSIVDAYNRAVGTDRKASFQDVMYIAAQCPSDPFGTFHPTDMATVPIRENGEPMPILALQYPLSRLSDEERIGVLERISEPGGYRYRFRNQMMRQYVLMRQAYERGLL